MLLGLLPQLFAVHISDGILDGAWLAGGFAVAGVLALVAAWRIRDEEIPRIALLTAAFFVASSIHVRVGPSSWHLLLNGLVGVVLGRRAALAIPVGLALQYVMLMHGGFTTLGINTCIMLLPALLAAGIFAGLRNAPWLRQAWFRALLIGASALVWVLSSVYSVTLLVTNGLQTVGKPDFDGADAITFHPLTLTCAVFLAAGAAWLERRLQTAPEFALGLLIGELTVLATIALNGLVLLWGGEVDWRLALALVILHLPIAALEGVIVGFVVGFLAKVKPSLLGWPAPVGGLADLSYLDGLEREKSHALPNAAIPPAPLVAGAAAGSVDGQHGAGSPDVRDIPGPAGQQSADRQLLRRG
jgi:cobalt/nickel transport system permease protein